MHVIAVIEYVDKQEKYTTAKKMERLEEIKVEYFCQRLSLHKLYIRLLYMKIFNSCVNNLLKQFLKKHSKNFSILII